MSGRATKDGVNSAAVDIPTEPVAPDLITDPLKYDNVWHGRYPTLCCEGYKRVYKITNPMTTTTTVEIQSWTPKRDLNTTVTAEWLASRANVTDPGLNINVGGKGNYGLGLMVRNETLPTTDMTLDITDPGRRPSKGLNKSLFQKYKEVKTTKYVIEAGATITHTCYIPGFKITHENLFNLEDNAEGNFIKDLTISNMIYIMGEHCYDNTAAIQKQSYCAGVTHTEYKDYTQWRMKPGGVKTFKFTTNAVEDFAIAFAKTNFYPVALVPTVAMPTNVVPSIDIATNVNMET